jgi:hypothetical protein
MSFMYLGFDIGLTGAVAVLNEQEVPVVFDITAIRTENDAWVDSRELALNLRSILKPEHVVRALMEDVQTRPNATKANGVVRQTSIKTEGSLMRSRGHIEALCALLNYKLMPAVRPQEWKKHFGLRGTDKHASLELARSLFPEAAKLYLSRVKDHNRADALLIALYCKRRHQ